MAKYRVGTRDSLLALAQTRQVIDELKSKTGHQFEIVAMKTSGDLDTSKPLWQMEGKNFFTKELDAALLENEVDFIVSSYKDIGSVRPDGLIGVAVTERHYSEDILLIKKDTVHKINKMKKMIVGTSSPRRIANISDQLSSLLPNAKIKIECANLRGNVNTRIQKLNENKYDAIVIALAGLERLANSNDTYDILKSLLKNLTFMILPEKTFPSSPGQGALFIECLRSNHELIDILACVHHDETAHEITMEKKHFHKFGGGCHLGIGVFAKKIRDGDYLVIKGHHQNERVYRESYDSNKYVTPQGDLAFIGMPRYEKNDKHFIYDQLFMKNIVSANISSFDNIFLTSSYGLHSFENVNYHGILWVSGEQTFKKATNLGLWVNGSADSFGESVIKRYISSKALSLMGVKKRVGILTSSNTPSDFGIVIPCYEKYTVRISDEFKNQMLNIVTFYWTCFNQYLEYAKRFPHIQNIGIKHCCGFGKTYDNFVAAGIDVTPFKDVLSFQIWFLNKDQ